MFFSIPVFSASWAKFLLGEAIQYGSLYDALHFKYWWGGLAVSVFHLISYSFFLNIEKKETNLKLFGLLAKVD